MPALFAKTYGHIHEQLLVHPKTIINAIIVTNSSPATPRLFINFFYFKIDYCIRNISHYNMITDKSQNITSNFQS